MKIYLPHIHYTVYVRRFKKAPPDVPHAQVYMRRLDHNSSAIYLREKEKPARIAHELIHVLQHICDVRDMDFLYEQEHMGYLMQYLMGKIQGHEYTDA